MLALQGIQIQAMTYNELVVTFRTWTRPTNMSRISSNLLTAEREYVRLQPLFGKTREIGENRA